MSLQIPIHSIFTRGDASEDTTSFVSILIYTGMVGKNEYHFDSTITADLPTITILEIQLIMKFHILMLIIKSPIPFCMAFGSQRSPLFSVDSLSDYLQYQGPALNTNYLKLFVMYMFLLPFKIRNLHSLATASE